MISWSNTNYILFVSSTGKTLLAHTVSGQARWRDERTLPRACKMSHCKVFRQQCFAGKIESPRTGVISIAASCDLTPIPCRQRLQHRGTFHCRLCIALKSSPGIYSPLAEYAIRSAAMAVLETSRYTCRPGIWLIQLKHQTYRTDWSPSPSV